MTDTQRRPAPYTRMDTERKYAVCNADSAAPQAGASTAGRQPSTLQSAITHGDGLVRWVRATFAPPSILTVQAPALQELREYARTAAYAGPSGPIRAAGIAWCHLVATPVLVVSRLWAWTWQRPARAIVIAATVKALSELPPVEWAVDQLIKPGVDFALWLFL